MATKNTNCLKGLGCPKCGQQDKLLIVARCWIALTDDGSDVFDDDLRNRGDVEYDNDSLTECPDCGYSGELRQFYRASRSRRRVSRC